jgi:hypothetical protein
VAAAAGSMTDVMTAKMTGVTAAAGTMTGRCFCLLMLCSLLEGVVVMKLIEGVVCVEMMAAGSMTGGRLCLVMFVCLLLA